MTNIPPGLATVDARQAAANNALLDIVATRTGARNGAKLAAILHLSAPTLSKIRNGRLAIGASLQMSILEFGDVSLAELREYVPRQALAVMP